MGVKMTILVNIIIILTLLQHTLESHILDDENVKLSMKYLCPGVDICEWDQQDWNSTFRDIGGTPCCIGCSCQKDCDINMNCCFSGDMEDMPNNNTSSTFDNGNAPIEQGNSSLEIDRKALLSNEENANIDETNMSMSFVDSERLNAHIHDTSREIMTRSKVNETLNRENMTVDNDSKFIDIELATKQCLYTRTGTPDINWIANTPAYRMVTSPPPGGCNMNTICPSLTQQNKQATCDSGTAFPWGDLFPVYSDDHKLIFKNELCACCYGILDYKPWSPLLECDDRDGFRYIPISEHLSFLQESNSFPDHCNVFFEYYDTRVLLDNKCFVNITRTCQFSADFLFRVPEIVNLTRPEIITLCNIGPDAPFISRSLNGGRVHKNVFCAMCNNILIDESSQCAFGYGYTGNKFTHLLDIASVQRITHVGKKNQIAPRPDACLKNNDNWIEDSCRQIYCPSGQLRDVDGVCTFPSANWFHDAFGLTVNLKYIPTSTTILRMLNKEDVRIDDVVIAFRKTNPWPSEWVITEIFHTAEDYEFSPRMAVYLLTTISRPETITDDIKTAMRLHWTVVLNGIDFAFEQSFLKYEVLPSYLPTPTYEPVWLMFLNDIESHIKIPVNELTYWELLVDNLTSTQPSFAYNINKLLICEHISLLENEYTMVFEIVLINRLTNQVMFDKEFEAVKDGDGKPVTRICLADSPFVVRSEKSGASTVSYFIHHLVWVKLLITVAIGACTSFF